VAGPTARRYPGQRLLRISLRTAHIAAAVMVLGAIAHHLPVGAWKWVLAASGLGILADDLYRYGPAWFRWLQFWAAAFKVGMVLLGLAFDPWLAPGHWAALVVGSFISHAPGRFRHKALWGPPAT